MKKFVLPALLLSSILFTGCEGEHSDIMPIGQTLSVEKVQHSSGDSYQVAIIQNGQMKWFGIGGVHFVGLFIDNNVKHAYLKRNNDVDTGAGAFGVVDVYEIHIPKDVNIEAGQVQTGKNQYIQTQMIYGNNK